MAQRAECDRLQNEMSRLQADKSRIEQDAARLSMEHQRLIDETAVIRADNTTLRVCTFACLDKG